MSVVDSQITSGWGNFHLEIEDTLIHAEVNFVFPAAKQVIRFRILDPIKGITFQPTSLQRFLTVLLPMLTLILPPS